MLTICILVIHVVYTYLPLSTIVRATRSSSSICKYDMYTLFLRNDNFKQDVFYQMLHADVYKKCYFLPNILCFVCEAMCIKTCHL